jgi:inosine/xanthosine triphosphatase
MKKIVVASTNPVKKNAALAGFQRMFPEESFEVEGVATSSGISDQPMGETETFRGAMTRVENVSKAMPDADFWVGIEGGLEDREEQMVELAWVIVKSADGKIGKARSATFQMPNKIAELVRQGKELGEANDIAFGLTNSKQANGAVGIFTRDVITRESYCTETVILALIPFRNPDLF